MRGNNEVGLEILNDLLSPVLKISITLLIFNGLGKIPLVVDLLINFESGTQIKSKICLKIRVGIQFMP